MNQTLLSGEVATAEETWQSHDERLRHFDDTTTWLAEVLDGSMRTSFEYSFDGEDLYGRDGGALGTIFRDSIKDAEITAARTPSLAFELRRRRIEHQEYQDMLAMVKGELPNTMVVVSDFPPELMDATSDVGGYNARRKQTMLRVIMKNEDGTITMLSQSLDRSDRLALEAIYGHFGFVPEPGELLGQRIHQDFPPEEQAFLIDWLTGSYDRALSAQYGGEWHAGRTPAERLNTYDFVRSQEDLVGAFVSEKLQNPSKAESLRFGLAAAMESRFKNRLASATINYAQQETVYSAMAPIEEMGNAGRIATLQGKTYSGCGFTVSGEAIPPGQRQLSEAGYGNKTEGKEDWKWKSGICRTSGCPTRPAKTKVGPCSVCTGCQHLYDKGKDPEKEYKLRRANARNN